VGFGIAFSVGETGGEILFTLQACTKAIIDKRTIDLTTFTQWDMGCFT
jgi:hypothetical protein